MTPPGRIADIVQQAVALPPELRDRFVASACGNDLALAAAVLAHLRSPTAATASLLPSIEADAEATVGSPRLGQRLGAYRLMRELGQGGMGTVFLARRDDDAFHKEVAIKLLRRGFESAESVARFRAERQILAALDHPGIVRLLDGGSTAGGVPYLVMEHVEGTPITTYGVAHRLSIRERVALFRQVCAAVAFAHQHLVVHRDLKPGNILVGADGAPKLLDFGIAKLLDEPADTAEALTRTGVQLLTLDYGSPEQARGEAITVASDVYSLGAVLYELLSGARAHNFAAQNVAQMLRAIAEVEPPPPSSVAPAVDRRTLRGDLDNITLKALQKEPGRRYASVEQLSEDLRRHLDGLPVAARANTWSYRAGKFVRRRRTPLAAAALVAVSLTTSTVVSIREARRAERRFGQVRELANSLLFEVDGKLRGIEGATAARELIVQRARQYLDGLTDEADDDPELAREVASAYRKTAEILANPFSPNLGRPEDGLESCRHAAAILERLLAAAPGDQASRRLLVQTLQDMAAMLSADGQPRAARDSLLAAATLSAELPRATDGDREAQLRGVLALYEVDRKGGDLAHLSEDAANFSTLATRWLEAAPTHPTARYWRAIGHEVAGLAHELAGDPQAARQELELASSLLAALANEQPEAAIYRRELAVVGMLFAQTASGNSEDAIWLPALGDSALAESRLRDVLPLLERLVARDPDDQRVALQLAGTLTGLAIPVAAERPAEAILLFERARGIYAALPVAVRQSSYAREFESATNCAMAESLARAGRTPAAREAMATGLAMATAAATEAQAGFDEQSSLLMCRYQAVAARTALGDPSATGELAPLAAELRRLIALQPAAIQPYIGLATVLEQQAAQQPARGCDLTAEALAVWRAWPGAATSWLAARQDALERRLATCPTAPRNSQR